jgi:hypothetical protein
MLIVERLDSKAEKGNIKSCTTFTIDANDMMGQLHNVAVAAGDESVRVLDVESVETVRKDKPDNPTRVGV